LGVPDEETGVIYGHDVRFCRLAQKAGIQTYVDFSVKVGHFGEKPFTLADNRIIVQTNKEINDSLKQHSVDYESLSDEDHGINYTIPRPENYEKDENKITPTIVPAPDELVIPKEAIE